MAAEHRKRPPWVGWSPPTVGLAAVALACLLGLSVPAGAGALRGTPGAATAAGPQAGPSPTDTAGTASTARSGAPGVAAGAAAPAGPPAEALPPASGAGRRIVYCNSCQRVWLVEEDGTVARTYPVSGRRGTPRPGTYQVESKTHPGGTEAGLRLDHMVRFTKGRRLWIGFHAIPVGGRGAVQRLEQLGTPLSQGCIRQAPEDARALWDFAPVGTPVVVLR